MISPGSDKSREEVRRVLAMLQDLEVRVVVIEVTVGREWQLAAALDGAGVSIAGANPRLFRCNGSAMRKPSLGGLDRCQGDSRDRPTGTLTAMAGRRSAGSQSSQPLSPRLRNQYGPLIVWITSLELWY